MERYNSKCFPLNLCVFVIILKTKTTLDLFFDNTTSKYDLLYYRQFPLLTTGGQ